MNRLRRQAIAAIIFLGSVLILISSRLIIEHMHRVVVAAPALMQIKNVDPNNDTELIRNAINHYLTDNSLRSPPNYLPYEVEHIKIEDDWAIANLVSFLERSPEHGAPPDVKFVISNKVQGSWNVYIEGTIEYEQVASYVPESMQWVAKRSNMVRAADITSITRSVPALPYAPGKAWRFNQGPNPDHYLPESIDFGVDPRGQSGPVHAMDSGRIIQAHSTCLTVERQSDSLQMFYQHIRGSDVQHWKLGDSVTIYDLLGMTTIDSGCKGTTSGHHVHITFQENGKQIDIMGFRINGWTVGGQKIQGQSTLTKENRTVYDDRGDTIFHEPPRFPLKLKVLDTNGLGISSAVIMTELPNVASLNADIANYGAGIYYLFDLPVDNLIRIVATSQDGTQQGEAIVKLRKYSTTEVIVRFGFKYDYTQQQCTNLDTSTILATRNALLDECQAPIDETIPKPPIPPDTDIPASDLTCGKSLFGVVLFSDRNYQGRCIHLLEGKYNLADYNLDNSVSSIRINGNYQVDLYEDPNQSGRRDELHKSDPNLDIRSLGEQYSSVRIRAKDKESNCKDDDKDGVYFYSQENFTGNCHYATGDIQDFGKTSIGNNNVASVRIVGDWRVNLYRSQNFKERGCGFGDDQGDMSECVGMHKNASSARIRKDEPEETPVPDCPAPQLLGPENGSVTGNRTITLVWTSVACPKTDSNDNYQVRISTSPNMDGGAALVDDRVVAGTQDAFSFDAKWENQNLYWSVRVANPQAGAAWATPRHFTVKQNEAPIIVMTAANDVPISEDQQSIWDSRTDWTFTGTASDSDGAVDHVEADCFGATCGGVGFPAQGTTNWSYQRSNVTGKHHISLYAVDDDGARSNGENVHAVNLWVDQARPETGIVLNNTSNPASWPAWFTGPVVVQLAAHDKGSGEGRYQATAGSKEIRYRLNGGEWTSESGSQLFVEIGDEGEHTLEYYAVDNVDNTEAVRSRSIRIDYTPPAPPQNVIEASGVVSGAWQSSQQAPTFHWDAATDSGSGVSDYQFYLGINPEGEGYASFKAGDLLSWTPRPNGVRTGTYYLRGRTRDAAGNWSLWSTLFVFRYDGAAPLNPTDVVHGAEGVGNGQWQKVTSKADFTWSAPTDDDGAAIARYYVYWGTEPNGISDTFVTEPRYQNDASACPADAACTVYLRLRSEDVGGEKAAAWTTVFVLRYDNVPPVVDFTINNGASRSNSVRVLLNINDQDVGSGAKEMSLSANGTNWSSWQPFTKAHIDNIAGIEGETTAFFVKTRDGSGLESAPVSRSITFELGDREMRSESYIMSNSTVAAGSSSQASQSYRGHSTVGESFVAPTMQSQQYLLLGGYEAIESTQLSAPGPITLPSPATCEGSPVVVNDGAGFTNEAAVTLKLCWLDAQEMRISNSVGFGRATWQPYRSELGWTLDLDGSSLRRHFVHVEFRDGDMNVYGIYSGSIYYDAQAPDVGAPIVGDSLPDNPNVVRAANVSGASAEELTLVGPQGTEIYVDIRDDSGRTLYAQISEQADFADAAWEPTDGVLFWQPAGEDGEKTLHIRLRDEVGNVSPTRTARYLQDTTPPQGGIGLHPYVVGPDTDSVEVYLAANDLTSGVREMRISTDPLLLLGEVWRPYTTTLTIPAYMPLQGKLTLYVQYRDSALNVSDVVSDTYRVDLDPPTVQASAAAGPADKMTRQLTVLSADGLSRAEKVFLSNDSSMRDAEERPYAPEITWSFDERRVVWVQIEDSVGNRSEAVPVTAEIGDESTSPNTDKSTYLPLIKRE